MEARLTFFAVCCEQHMALIGVAEESDREVGCLDALLTVLHVFVSGLWLAYLSNFQLLSQAKCH